MKRTASIPFSFAIGGKVLPAGKYTVKRLSMSNNVILLQSVDGQSNAMFQTQRAYTNQRWGSDELRFNRYGDQHFLSQIRTAGESTHYELSRSDAERELAKATSKNSVAKNTPVTVAVPLVAQK